MASFSYANIFFNLEALEGMKPEINDATGAPAEGLPVGVGSVAAGGRFVY